MAEISPEDRKDIDTLAKFQLHNLAQIAEKMVAKKGQNPALDSAGRKFTELAAAPDPEKANLSEKPAAYLAQAQKAVTLARIDKQLDNPQTRRDVEALLERDPKGFETVLPQIFQNPDATGALLKDQLAKAMPQRPAPPAVAPSPLAVAAAPAAPAAAKTPAPAAAVAGSRPSPLAPAPQPATPQQPAPVAAAQEPPKAAPGGGGMRDFITFLGEQEAKTPGITADFAKFQSKMESNQVPAVSDAYRALLGGTGDPKEQDQTLNALKKQIQSNPKIFADINKTLDEKPGQAATLVSTISGAGSAKGGFGALAAYSALSNSAFGQSQFGKMLIGLIDGLFKPGGLGQMFSGFLGTMKGQFASSSATEQIVQSNNNGRQTQDLNAKAGVQPQTVKLQGPNGDKQEMTGAQFASRGTTAPAAATPEQQRLQQAVAVEPSSPG